MRCDMPPPAKKKRAGHVGAGMSAYDELQSVHQLPHEPCHYVFALASPDACRTHRMGASGSEAKDVAEIPRAMPLAPWNDTGAFGHDRVQTDPQERRPERDPAKVAAQRRAAEEAHRSSMEEARKQQLLDMQMQRQLEQLQKQRARGLPEKETASSKLADHVEPMQAPTASKVFNTINGEEVRSKETRDDVPQLSHGVLSGFGSPPATPDGVPPRSTDDREL